MNSGTNDNIVGEREIQPMVPDAFYPPRKLKPYDQNKLAYVMSASTNGPHIASGIPSEVAPKRGSLNNNRPLHYIDVNMSQDLVDCSAVLYVSLS